MLADKLKKFTTPEDRPKINELIRKELYNYPEVSHDCESIQGNLWEIVKSIIETNEISIEYYRTDRKWVTHRLRPRSAMFTDYYFYLIAFLTDGKIDKPYYFSIDSIKQITITIHPKNFDAYATPDFDEGLLRKRSLFMWLGKLRTIRFEFSGDHPKRLWISSPQPKSLNVWAVANTSLKPRFTVTESRYGY